MMHFIKTLKNIGLGILILVIGVSCSNDDQATSEPQMGYFVKEIVTFGEHDSLVLSFEYDNHNRMISQRSNDLLMEFGYNDLGQMTTYKEDGKLLFGFEYSNDLITKQLIYSPVYDSITEEITFTFSNGYYISQQDTIIKIGQNKQILEYVVDQVKFLYGEEMGVHPHLSPIPARFLIDPDALLYDMTISNQELQGFSTLTRLAIVMSSRNDKGLIERIDMKNMPDERITQSWEITYEQRILKP